MLDSKIIPILKNIWDYFVLDMEIKKSDIIIGCGCKNTDIPLRCVELFKKKYADKILFTGGLGKITKNCFNIPEARRFKKIAIENGIPKNKIFIEDKSTNTGDNFRFSIEVIKKNNLKFDNILIVHNNLSQRRTLLTAKAIIPDKKIYITSPKMNFEGFIRKINKKDDKTIKQIISVIVGDIQRIIIFPQLGWQIEETVPKNIIKSYFELKNKGYDDFIFSKEEIKQLILKNKKQENYNPIYFY